MAVTALQAAVLDRSGKYNRNTNGFTRLWCNNIFDSTLKIYYLFTE